jgi:hypothetical protein
MTLSLTLGQVRRAKPARKKDVIVIVIVIVIAGNVLEVVPAQAWQGCSGLTAAWKDTFEPDIRPAWILFECDEGRGMGFANVKHGCNFHTFGVFQIFVQYFLL